ncbi:MAG: T9SS type A sorting domain-containing protein [Candidatus Marinimicrobia bacterium]|nr:T9SS type A sorting domain-containing protein [Candidatus Neomarinimicrobiota bacterium]
MKTQTHTDQAGSELSRRKLGERFSITVCLLMTLFAFELQAKTELRSFPAGDASVQIIESQTGRQVPLNLLESRNSKNPGEAPLIRLKRTQHQRVMNPDDVYRDDLLWTLRHVDDNAEYYLGSGVAEDTFAVVFTAAVTAIVREVYMQWYTPGTVQAFGADYNDSARAISPDGECSTIDSGSFSGTPIGALRTPITTNIIEFYSADWSSQLDIGGTFMAYNTAILNGPPQFVIGLVKTANDPMPLADATDDQGGLTYTWFGGPSTGGSWRRYSPQVDLMMLVKIEYFDIHPPVVNMLSVLSNTYNTEGPFTVFAEIFDGDFVDNDSIVFHWTVNDIETEGSPVPVDVDPSGSGLYSYEISGTFDVGDEIEYWIITSNGIMVNESIHLQFEIKEPIHPDAELLIIADQAADEQVVADLYRRAADNIGLEYEFWDTSIEKGIDASVIQAGWSNILVYGWTTDVVPVIEGETDPGFADFLNNGGHLVLADQDLFFSHGLAPDLQFEAGDFAHDYFGLASATNDPINGDEVSVADTVFYGIAGTDIDMDFMNTPLVLNHALYGTSNWGDYLVPGNALPLFQGASDSMIYGVAYDAGTFKTALLGFMPDAAVTPSPQADFAYDQFETLLTGIVHWMGITTDVDRTAPVPTEFELIRNYPNPFNPATTIEYQIAEASQVQLGIYDMNGSLVRMLVNTSHAPGYYGVQWNGTKTGGEPAAAGLYFAQFQTGEGSSALKLVLLK